MGFRYAHIAEEIIGEINMGLIKPGQSIPSARELCEGAWLGQRMAMASAQRVQRIVIDSGLVEVMPGRRIFVKQPQDA
jgi:DNA-binding transcriptional regulator YhcF (GntR family)